MTSEVKQQQLEWRRAQVLELASDIKRASKQLQPIIDRLSKVKTKKQK